MIPDKVNKPRFYIDHINFQKAHRSANSPNSLELGCYIQSGTETRLQPDNADFDEEYYYEWRKIFGLNNSKEPFILETHSDITGESGLTRAIKMQVSKVLSVKSPVVTFAGAIGHNLATKNAKLTLQQTSIDGSTGSGLYQNNLMNTRKGYTNSLQSGDSTFDNDGISLWQKPRDVASMTNDDDSLFEFYFVPTSASNWDTIESIRLGSLFFGHHYDMPFNCEISSTQTRTFDGVQSSRNNAGADRVNVKYFNDRSWADVTPKMPFLEEDWGELELKRYREHYPHKTMTDKKRWSLTFSQLSHNDVIPSIDTYSLELGGNPYTNWDQLAINDHYPIGTITAGNDYTYGSDQIGGSGEEITNYVEHSFVSQVLNYTMGGRLKFLFQPNPSFSNIDDVYLDQSVIGMQSSDLYLCKFDMKTFEIAATGANTYQIKIDVVEVW